MLDEVDLSLSLSRRAFKHARRWQRQRLYDLEKMAFDAGLPTAIVFEGWDAAGKGTTIRQLTRRLDPRGFVVHSIQAPRTQETKMPWLWRFWMKIPSYGQMAIFDRSWYGRVTIERVEGLTPIPDWIRAYEEINEFERTLADDGMIFVKFWLHITKEEQLRRLIDITNDPDRAWQVTAEDWERHRKYDEYRAAVEDMLSNTHTPHAPWTVVPSTDMYYRMYHVFKIIIDTLEKALDVEATEWQSLQGLEAAAAQAKAEKKARKKAKKAAKKAAKEAARRTAEAERQAVAQTQDSPPAEDGHEEQEAVVEPADAVTSEAETPPEIPATVSEDNDA